MDYLTEVALRGIWCAPDQDYQAIVLPDRITPSYGTRKSIKLVYNLISLPNQEEVFHVFQFKELNPYILGLFPSYRQWRTLSQNMVEQKMLVNLYNEKGLQLPRNRCWYMVTQDRNLLIAIEEPKRIDVSPGTEPVYARFYSNAYFNSTRQTGQTAIVYGGAHVKQITDITKLQDQIANLAAEGKGETTCFINGKLVRDLNPVAATIGDEIEYVHDYSIKRVVHFKIKDLKRYTSTMDQLAKYLVTYPEALGDEELIEYYDDNDLYLYKPNGPKEYTGVYIHHNDARTARMVTHRDYGIAIKTIEAISRNNDWNTSEDVYLKLYIRHSGFSRPLIYETSRIHELYKLPFEMRLKAMVGEEATVPVWRAEALEASSYTYIMRYKTYRLPKVKVDECFGYYSAASLTSQTPQKVGSVVGVPSVINPVNLVTRATGYEYDAEGKLLGYYDHLQGTTYYTRNANAALVELIKGTGTDYMSDVFGMAKSDYDPKYDYRFYACGQYEGVIDYDWVDVTDTDKYAIQGADVLWFEDPYQYTRVRRNDTFLSYEFDQALSGGVLKFTLRNRIYQGDSMVTKAMDIPMAQLDVFLNQYALIEGIDYIVNFPEVVIINKSRLKYPLTGKQRIHVRFKGHCDSSLLYKVEQDAGFVSHDLVSKNRKFQLRDDKVIRAVVNGCVKHRDDLKFAESTAGTTALNALNGKPYMLRDEIVPVREVTSFETYPWLAQAKATDSIISDYLTPRIPQPDVNFPNVIEDKYPVYSPFLTAILYDLTNGYLDIPWLYEQTSDEKVKDAVKEYEPYLAFDPTQLDHRPDLRYVEIHPHPQTYVVSLPIHKYRFLQRVVDVYCQDTVNLSHFIKLEEF